jgi:hypothetical protein
MMEYKAIHRVVLTTNEVGAVRAGCVSCGWRDRQFRCRTDAETVGRAHGVLVSS